MDQLPPAVWLQLLLLIAAVFVLVFGGAWVLRWFFNRGRTGEITDDEHPDNTLTVAIEAWTPGSFAARFLPLFDGRLGAPADPASARTLTELRSAVDAAIVEWHHAQRLRQDLKDLVVDYSIYPWDEGEMPRQIAEQIGTDWLVFEVTEADGRFIARHGSTGLAATAPSLDALPLAVQAAIGANWPSLVPHVPGMLTWQRSLTTVGFAPPAVTPRRGRRRKRRPGRQ